MKSFGMFGKKFLVFSIIYICVCLIVCAIPAILTQGGSIVDFTKTGQIGDTIGGIMGPFVAMIAAYLTFIAFWVQYYANKQQRDDIATERFNQTFFSLMDIHEQITDALEFTIPRQDENPISHKGREFFYYAFENKAAVNQIEEKNCFLSIFSGIIKSTDKLSTIKLLFFINELFMQKIK